jgi:hypothetical protein
MVITRANIIGIITRTITGDTLPIMGTTAIRTGIMATLAGLESVLVFYSTSSKLEGFASKNRKHTDKNTQSNSNNARERDNCRVTLDPNSLDSSRTQPIGRYGHPAR